MSLIFNGSNSVLKMISNWELKFCFNQIFILLLNFCFGLVVFMSTWHSKGQLFKFLTIPMSFVVWQKFLLLLKSQIAQKMSAHFFVNMWLSKSSHEILSIKSNIALIAIKMSAQIIACIRIPSQLTQKMLKHVKIVKYCTKNERSFFVQL